MVANGGPILMEHAFGSEVNFEQLVKLYGDYGQRAADAKHSPANREDDIQDQERRP